MHTSARNGLHRTVPLALFLLALGLFSAPGLAGAAGAASVDDLLFDFQLTPLDGKTPPPFTLSGLNGQRVSLADFKGQVVMLYFWATW